MGSKLFTPLHIKSPISLFEMSQSKSPISFLDIINYIEISGLLKKSGSQTRTLNLGKREYIHFLWIIAVLLSNLVLPLTTHCGLLEVSKVKNHLYCLSYIFPFSMQSANPFGSYHRSTSTASSWRDCVWWGSGKKIVIIRKTSLKFDIEEEWGFDFLFSLANPNKLKTNIHV